MNLDVNVGDCLNDDDCEDNNLDHNDDPDHKDKPTCSSMIAPSTNPIMAAKCRGVQPSVQRCRFTSAPVARIILVLLCYCAETKKEDFTDYEVHE